MIIHFVSGPASRNGIESTVFAFRVVEASRLENFGFGDEFDWLIDC